MDSETPGLGKAAVRSRWGSILLAQARCYYKFAHLAPQGAPFGLILHGIVHYSTAGKRGTLNNFLWAAQQGLGKCRSSTIVYGYGNKKMVSVLYVGLL